MRTVALVIGAALLLGPAGSSFAVNCKQVNKYLQTGRSVKDVAETMVIDEADVKKCQAEAAEGAGAGGAGAGGAGGEKKPGDTGTKEMK